MLADARLLTSARVGAAELVKLVTEQLPGACTHGTAPDHVFERITREARSIIQSLKQKTTA
jgi:hypothetical protein